MRWDILKKAWGLARSNFPDAQKLYVQIPSVFKSHGECKIYDLASPDKPLGAVSYQTVTSKGEPVLTMTLDKGQAEVRASFGLGDVRVGMTKRAVAGWPSVLSADLVCQRYKDPFEIGRLAAIMAKEAIGESVAAEDLRAWMASQGYSREMETPIRAGLLGLGVSVEYETSFNIKQAKGKKFKEEDRVRIVHPTSMEYQEVGRVMGCEGDSRSGYWYSVLVDGSGSPMMFPESALEKDEAGDIVDPVPRPIADE